MGFKDKLLPLLRCPKCHGSFAFAPSPSDPLADFGGDVRTHDRRGSSRGRAAGAIGGVARAGSQHRIVTRMSRVSDPADLVAPRARVASIARTHCHRLRAMALQ